MGCKVHKWGASRQAGGYRWDGRKAPTSVLHRYVRRTLSTHTKVELDIVLTALVTASKTNKAPSERALTGLLTNTLLHRPYLRSVKSVCSINSSLISISLTSSRKVSTLFDFQILPFTSLTVPSSLWCWNAVLKWQQLRQCGSMMGLTSRLLVGEEGIVLYFSANPEWHSQLGR